MTSTTTTVRKSYGNRKINTCTEDYYRLVKQRNQNVPKKNEDVAKLIKYIDDNIIGKNNAFLGPFGRRKVVFCDYVSSGRSLQFIEEYILREVLPSYGNTHSTTNITSLQSTLFRQEAREIIKNAVNASEEDAVIFVGHGCTGAIKKIVSALDLHEPPIVFVGASEHQDNLQIWQDIGAIIIRIAETKQNFLDLNDLEDQLKLHHNSGRQLIGCFAATSSVTGILVDDVASTMLLHQYGALAFWDYNIAAPYVPLNMNPKVPGVAESSIVYKDAIYFSGHKFVGGVQTPGILVAKKSLFKRVSSCENDGFFALHEQNKSFELQEEGTSAAVIESVRAGLVMQLKETVTVANIVMRQEKITKQMLQHIRTIPEIILLGNSSTGLKRIPVFSFMVRHPRGTFLHHNFVTAVLNDVFGIQARGGCPCSGAYAQDLLGIDQNLANQYENIILEDRRLSSLNLSMESSYLELLRPGFTRISLPYFISDGELAFVMEAVKMVATEGWKLLPQYSVDLDTGEWRHHTNPISKDRKWLGSIRYVDGKMTMNERRISGPGLFPQSYSECLQTARNLFNRARKMAMRNTIEEHGITFDARAEKLRWFMLQKEAQMILTGNPQNIKHGVPFNPLGFSGSKRIDIKDNREAELLSSNSSPRHFSLPAIDDHRILTSSSPIPYFVQEFYYPPHPAPAVNFAVGEVVSSSVLTPVPQSPLFFRERCYSLGAAQSSAILSPQTRLSLGITGNRRRNCSCSSANDFQSLDSDNNSSPTQSINTLENDHQRTQLEQTDQFDTMAKMPQMDAAKYSNLDTSKFSQNHNMVIVSTHSTEIHPSCVFTTVTTNTNDVNTFVFSSPDMQYVNKEGQGYIQESQNCLHSTMDMGRSSPSDIQTYVKEMTKELATNIKSEIREVISKVEDALENTDNISFEKHGSGSEDGRSDSISANEVAEYLEKVSKEMANEVKSEIRDVVSAVDVYFTPDKRSYSRASSSGGESDRCPKSEYTPGSSSETVIQMINKSSSTNRLCEEEKVFKNKLLASTITSLSSQDSGINLSFHEQDHGVDLGRRSSSESTTSNRLERGDTMRPPSLHKHSEHDDSLVPCISSLVTSKWSCPPKNIWQSTVEAIQEFEMIQNGDRILICLSGGKDSLSLLHTLLQYQSVVNSKGISFSIGAITIDSDTSRNDPGILIQHLKSLGVHYLFDGNIEIKKEKDAVVSENENYFSFASRNLRRKLYATAKTNGYNVLAIGQHLDDLVESFILAVFHTGKLKSLKGHYYVRDHDLRVIRPFVYVREKSLRQFVTSQNLPATPNAYTCPDISKQRQRAKQLLAQQEILFPKLFNSLKSALSPLISFALYQEEFKFRRRLKSKDNDDSDVETDEEPVLKTD